MKEILGIASPNPLEKMIQDAVNNKKYPFIIFLSTKIHNIISLFSHGWKMYNGKGDSNAMINYLAYIYSYYRNYPIRGEIEDIEATCRFTTVMKKGENIGVSAPVIWKQPGMKDVQSIQTHAFFSNIWSDKGQTKKIMIGVNEKLHMLIMETVEQAYENLKASDEMADKMLPDKLNNRVSVGDVKFAGNTMRIGWLEGTISDSAMYHSCEKPRDNNGQYCVRVRSAQSTTVGTQPTQFYKGKLSVAIKITATHTPEDNKPASAWVNVYVNSVFKYVEAAIVCDPVSMSRS
jgi:hypothetical protein